MKCSKCGSEMRNVREEHCRDAAGNPMYMDYAVCGQCGNKVQVSKNAYKDGESPGIRNDLPNPKNKVPIWAKILIGIGCFFGFFFFIGMVQGVYDIATGNTEPDKPKTVAESTKKPKPTKESEFAEEPTATPDVTEIPEPTPESTPTPKPTLSPAQKKKIEREKARKAKEKAKKAKKNFIAKCKSYSYKKVLRNPAKYYGKKIKLKCKISQISEGGWFSEGFYRCYTYSGYGIWAENEYVILDERESKKPRLLQDDIITVYGTISEPREITRALTGVSDEVFAIDMKYVTVHG